MGGPHAACGPRRARRRRRWPSPAPATRACSATRWSSRTCSAPRPAPGSAPRSCSPCCAPATRDWPVDPAPVAAFVVALLTVFVTYVVGAAFGGSRTGVTLVLAGVAVSSLASAIQIFLLQRNVEVVREVYSWILGRLSTGAVGRRPARAAIRRRVGGRAAGPSPAPRPVPRRRGRGGDARRPGRPRAPGRRDRGDARHGSRRVGERDHRFRRHRRAAPRAPRGRGELSTGAAAVVPVRRGVPDHRRRPGSGAPGSGRDPHRRRHRVPRGAVPDPRPAHQGAARHELVGAARSRRRLRVAPGARPVQRPRPLRRVARADRPERGGEVIAAARRGRRGRRAPATSSSTALRSTCGRGGAGPSSWPMCRSRRRSPTT